MLCDDWILSTDVDVCYDTSAVDATLLANALTAASDWMYRATGQRWPGVCDVTERPCHVSCANLAYCNCATEDRLLLTYGPVTGSPSVTIDGVAFTAFSVVQPNLLVRTDDLAWPSCQAYVDTATGIIVTYQYGETPPQLAKDAAAALAAEIIKDCSGDTCSLPAGTVAVNRRGVSVQLDPEEAGKALPQVAMALSVYGREGRVDIRVAGKRGLITSGPV